MCVRWEVLEGRAREREVMGKERKGGDGEGDGKGEGGEGAVIRGGGS